MSQQSFDSCVASQCWYDTASKKIMIISEYIWTVNRTCNPQMFLIIVFSIQYINTYVELCSFINKHIMLKTFFPRSSGRWGKVVSGLITVVYVHSPQWQLCNVWVDVGEVCVYLILSAILYHCNILAIVQQTCTEWHY